jgi:hypothetical protein
MSLLQLERDNTLTHTQPSLSLAHSSHLSPLSIKYTKLLFRVLVSKKGGGKRGNFLASVV